GLRLGAPCLEALLALTAFMQAALQLLLLLLEQQIAGEEIFLEAFGVDESNKILPLFLEILDYLRDGFFKGCFAFVLLPAIPGFEGNAEKCQCTVGTLGELHRAPGFELKVLADIH